MSKSTKNPFFFIRNITHANEPVLQHFALISCLKSQKMCFNWYPNKQVISLNKGILVNYNA